MYARDFALIATPIGMVRLSGTADLIEMVAIESERLPETTGTRALREGAAQILAYFAGTLTCFDLPLAPLPSPRGEALRAAMMAVRFGETCSYGAIARMTGSAARAVGQACARNPLPIIVPCHRITNAGGSLGAYSAGEGVATKRWLVDFEQGVQRLI